MKNTIKMLLGLSVLCLPWSAQATIFMCKDASGRTISSDRPIAECAGAVREFASNGQLKGTIPAPLTPEQIKQKQLDEEKSKAQAAAAAEQKRQDSALLARYNSESEIETARQRAVVPLQEQMKRETAALAESEKQLAGAQSEVNAYKNKKAKPPLALNRKAEQAQNAVEEKKKTLQEREAQIAAVNSKFDATRKRFHDITTPAADK